MTPCSLNLKRYALLSVRNPAADAINKAMQRQTTRTGRANEPVRAALASEATRTRRVSLDLVMGDYRRLRKASVDADVSMAQVLRAMLRRLTDEELASLAAQSGE